MQVRLSAILPETHPARGPIAAESPLLHADVLARGQRESFLSVFHAAVPPYGAHHYHSVLELVGLEVQRSIAHG